MKLLLLFYITAVKLQYYVWLSVLISSFLNDKPSNFYFKGNTQWALKASLLLIRASQYKYRRMVGECCIPKCMLK